MIGKIKGIIDTIYSDSLILDVQGVGYLLQCPRKTLGNIKINDEIVLFVETYVREDQITLYGFISLSEKQCFLKLITVKGVGPKLALQILSILSANQIINAIVAKEHSVFSQINGVGPKLVTRIFTELKEQDFAGLVATNFICEKENKLHNLKDDAVSALINLGISKIDAHSAISKIVNEQKNINLGDLIKLALHSLPKKVT